MSQEKLPCCIFSASTPERLRTLSRPANAQKKKANGDGRGTSDDGHQLLDVAEIFAGCHSLAVLDGRNEVHVVRVNVIRIRLRIKVLRVHWGNKNKACG